MPISALVVGGISAAGAIGGAAIQSNAAGNAANAQQRAAQQIIAQTNQTQLNAAAGVSSATGSANAGIQAALASGNTLLAQTLAAQQQNLSPYINAGTSSLSQLQGILGPNGALNGPNSQFGFTASDYANSPEFNFIQQQANQALGRSAAASGGALSGGLVRASDQLNTGLASTYLDQAFNRALSTYTTNRQNLLTQIQGLTNVTGLGFNASGALNQDLGVSGQLRNTNIQNAAQLTGSNLINSATYSGNTGLWADQIDAGAISGAANAQSGADLAEGKAWGGALTGSANTIGSLYALSQLPGGWGNNYNPPPSSLTDAGFTNNVATSSGTTSSPTALPQNLLQTLPENLI